MPIMRPLILALLFVLGFTHYRPLAPTHNIAAGEVNRNSDLVEGDVWTYSDQGFVYDRSSVVALKALVPLHGGTRIKRSEVDPKQSSWAKDLWNAPDSDDHTYIHSR